MEDGWRTRELRLAADREETALFGSSSWGVRCETSPGSLK